MRILPLSCLLALFSLPAVAVDAETTQVYFSNGQLEYVGFLDKDANARLFALYEALPVKPTTLSIRSGGGEVHTGMELGAWVHAHRLDVKVMEFCISSCANYVFPAGKKKIVSNFAMIGYHGGPGGPLELNLDDATQTMFDKFSAAEKQAFMDALKKTSVADGQTEAAFLRTIGVRGDISTLGQRDIYQPILDRHPDAAGWTYSLDDFALLGVHDISVINPPWTPASASGKVMFVTIPVNPAPARSGK